MNELLVKLNEVLEKSQEEARYLRSENKELKDHIKHLEMARKSMEMAQNNKPFEVPADFFTGCPFTPFSMLHPMGITVEEQIDCRHNLNGMSWSRIKYLCGRTGYRQFFSVGDTKDIILKNGEQITMRIIGIRHDTTHDGRKAALTWEMVDFMKDRHVMNKSCTNEGGWTSSEMRRYLNEDVFSLLPDEVQDVIYPVIKTTSCGGNKTGKVSTVDKLFLLSEHERYGRKFYSAGDEGRWYQWYRREGVSYAKKYPNGDSGWGWMRSPYGSNSASFCRVGSGGSAFDGNASSSDGVAFGFCM